MSCRTMQSFQECCCRKCKFEKTIRGVSVISHWIKVLSVRTLWYVGDAGLDGVFSEEESLLAEEGTRHG